MEAKLSQRKRKEPPNPLLGTLTRSKSQIYSHLNRSGRLRSDASVLTRCCRHRPSSQIDVSHTPRRRLKSSIPTAGEDAREVTLSPICIKDLRSRRVFSEPLVVPVQEEKIPVLGRSVERLECEVNPNMKFAQIDSLEEKSLSTGDCIDAFGEELTSSRPAEEGEKADMGVNCIGARECGENPNLSRSMGMCSEEKDGEIKAFGQGGERLGFQKVDSSCNGQRLDDVSPTLSNRDKIIDEENVQTTPPDPDIFASQKDGQNRLNGGHDVLQAEDNHSGMQSSGSPNRKIDFIPRRKLVLNPCRLKVFKTPSSVSYRRLLPYLLDIAKEKSSTKEFNSCSKIETVLEENPKVQSQVPLARDSHFKVSGFGDKTLKSMLHTTSEDNSIEEKFPSNMQAGNSTHQTPSKTTSMDCSSDTTWPTTVTTDRQNEMLSPSNSPRRDSSRVDQVSSAKRFKVFKTPSSVSYRRLLPYLMDVAKDKSCALKIKSCPKLETVLEEKPTVLSQVPLARASCIYMSDFEDDKLKSVLHTASQEMTEDGSTEKFPSSMQAGDSTNHIPINPTTIDCPSDNTWPSTVITDGQNEMSSPILSPQGDLSPVDQISSAKSGDVNISPALVSDPTVCFTDSTSNMPQGYSDGDHTTNIKTLENAITVYQSTSPFRDLPCSERYTVSSAKGILKRNPRGCRGLCTCLSCASFRLHAERAFDFSRNQLQDTEEMVLELMKELSQLRTVLEMSFDDSNSQASSKNYQFEEVCASASKAEEIARTRLKEMNEELSVHCRMKYLQRPRVNFDIKIEEKGLGREKPI